MTNTDNFITKMLDDVDRHTPKTGYNLVVIDDFEPFGEQLYTLGHYETYEAALAAQEQLSGNTVIYPHKREKE
ncbi:hypothetical protein [Nitrososphaera viennensis]|uniref:Uncharacterized protein n=2 Tax=Nitrososphaera viennensis TaxID=1034015 RepID=A0A060HU56_9ARCH|nr:hypothetical protein [Nitrososphaera viennensis]AIC16941.1 hypothetical protein NVIE_026710 [Nitrososphaera viennensis EN76]UVS68844.1 hypothetical protein NWT39_13165 [Nitrososphaera viennensis]CBX88951.1 hypothetical protein [Nitrososphaera phage Pro-Nvie1]